MTYSVICTSVKNKDIVFDIKNVVADGGIPDNLNVRYLICEDGERFEFPASEFVFNFSKERLELILAEKEKIKANEKNGE